MTEREFSIAEISIKQASRFELIEILTRAGGSGIGLWEYNNSPSRSDVGDVTSSGLRVTSYVPNENSVFPTAMSANNDDPLHRAGALRGSLERAAEYGAECVVILTGPILNESVEAMDILHRAIHIIAREASVLGVSLALEPIHASCARDFSAVSTLDQANRLLEVCETPEVGLALDTWHIRDSPGALAEIQRLGDRVRLVQVSAVKRRAVSWADRGLPRSSDAITNEIDALLRAATLIPELEVFSDDGSLVMEVDESLWLLSPDDAGERLVSNWRD
jgi:sugar phosphate isomerase/epimerase